MARWSIDDWQGFTQKQLFYNNWKTIENNWKTFGKHLAGSFPVIGNNVLKFHLGIILVLMARWSIEDWQGFTQKQLFYKNWKTIGKHLENIWLDHFQHLGIMFWNSTWELFWSIR